MTVKSPWSAHKLIKVTFDVHGEFIGASWLINKQGLYIVIDKPEAKSQSKAQSPKKPQKRKEEFGLWASH